MWYIALGLVCAALAGCIIYLRNQLMQAKDQIEELEREAEHSRTQPAIISHEIRTPLSLIRGASELLIEETPGPLNEIQRQFMGTISENSRLVSDISENFLSDLQLQKRQLDRAEVDIRDVISTTARELRRVSDVPIRVDAAGGVLRIVADEKLIRQLVWNLVNNAARHAGNQSAITVRVEGSSEGVHIVVSDSGEGMTDEELKILFTPFASGSTRRPGSGIGMMVSRKIVEAHGGEIFVDSSPGVGTAIHVTLPAQATGPRR